MEQVESTTSQLSTLEISATVAIGLLHTGMVDLVDVRQPMEFELGQPQIPGVVSLPLYNLKEAMGQTLQEDESELSDPADTPMVRKMLAEEHRSERVLLLICRSGRRSLEAARILKDLGYRNVLSVAGGVNAWKLAGGPLLGESQDQGADMIRRYHP